MTEKRSFKEVMDEIITAWNKKSKEEQREAIKGILKEYLFWNFVEELLNIKKQTLSEWQKISKLILKNYPL